MAQHMEMVYNLNQHGKWVIGGPIPVKLWKAWWATKVAEEI